MCHSHFEKMAGVVHLMLEAKIIPALALVLTDKICNQKTVLLLRRENPRDDPVHAFA